MLSLIYKKKKSYLHYASHMTKMAAMRIYCKNPLEISFAGTSGSISMKLGMKHRGIKFIIVYRNDDPQLTLTYFIARSKFLT